ncbi:Retinol dehydrogenase 7 [Bulinus truncatus]|nr:Retinol dehydrogenase 7 [Bulinus truncatus]
MIFVIALCATLFITTYFFVERVLRSFTVGNYGEKYVLVTGCGGGFGQALACHLDGMGFHVIAGCHTQKGMTYLKENCSDNLVTVLLDVSKDESIQEALREVKRLLSDGQGLWGLVNNAGTLGHVSISEVLTREDYQKVLDVNLLGLVETTRCFLPLVRKAKGRVVNMSSVGGRVSLMGGGYCLSKHGVEAFSNVLRRELFLRGVKVCIIEPGGFKTSLVNEESARYSFVTMFSKVATEEMKDCYGDVEALFSRMFFSKGHLLSSDLTPVVEAYTHALTARFLKTRTKTIQSKVHLRSI